MYNKIETVATKVFTVLIALMLLALLTWMLLFLFGGIDASHLVALGCGG